MFSPDTIAFGEPWFWLLNLAALFVGLSKGGLPAVAMLSVPILSLVISPLAAAALLLPIYIITDVVGVWLYRRNYSARNLKILIPTGVVGVCIGWATAAYVSDEMVSLLLGILGISFCLSRWLRSETASPPQPAALGKGLFWGTIAGFTSFVSHAGSPPYQIYVLPQKLAKTAFAGTSTITFAAINLAKVVPYAALQPYTTENLKICALLLPVALTGTMLGRYLTHRLPEKWFFLGVQIALFAISIKLVTKVIF